jgi:hypothetical protein
MITRSRSVEVRPSRLVVLDARGLMALVHSRARAIVQERRDVLPEGMDFFNAITQAMCTSYKQEILGGIHLAADTYKIALFTSSATLDASTTAYATTNEVTGTGYTAGGVTLAGFTRSNSGTTAWIDWTTDPSWASATITARGALIYNSTQSNKAVCVLDFGSDQTSTNGTFTIVFPAAAAGTALIRL